ncbi:MAG: hypothetical protein WCX74_01940 [Candidatus Paceibacterota bacterium]
MNNNIAGLFNIKDIFCIGIIAGLWFSVSSAYDTLSTLFLAILFFSVITITQFCNQYKASTTKSLIKTKTDKTFNRLLLLTYILVIFYITTKDDHSGLNFFSFAVFVLATVSSALTLTLRTEQLIMYFIDSQETKSK